MPRAQREILILDIAGHVFADDGYHAASMDEISRRAGVSKPMIYAYFGSKEGLYIAYIERTGQELLERLQATFVGDASASLRRRVREFLRFVALHRDGWRVLFTEASASRPVAEQVAQLRRRITAAVRRLLEANLTRLDPAEADAVAHAIVGAGESVANWWLEHPEVELDVAAGWYASVIRGTVAEVNRPQPA